MLDKDKLLQALRNTRTAPRVDTKYRVFRAIFGRLQETVNKICYDPKERESIIQDIENLAVRRAIKHFHWLSDRFIWSYSHKTRKTKLDKNLLDILQNSVVRYDEFLGNFLINYELLAILDELDKQPEEFVKRLERGENENE